MNTNSFWSDIPELESALNKVDQVIQAELQDVSGQLGIAVREHFQAKGKMLRPALFLLFFSGKNKKHSLNKGYRLAASIEMLHNATLIHDDIVDNSPIRHGKPSIYAKYGKHTAVYTGDLLFALSLNLLSKNASKLTNLQLNSKAMSGILQGEVAQFGQNYNLNITIEEYLKQIKGKTALLFGYSANLGALEGNLGQSSASHAKEFGENLGMLFQIQDDLLDYASSTEDFHKPVLLDVQDGVYSAPLIFALQKDDNNELHNLVKKRT